MALQSLYNLNKYSEIAKGYPIEHLFPWVNAQYMLFCSWINSQGSSAYRFPSPDLQVTSSYRKGDPGSHGKGLAFDISRTTTISHIQKQYLALFGLFLQKQNKGICHISISLHNVHIHIDCDPQRKGVNDVEIKKDNWYDFRPYSLDEVTSYYEFNDQVKALAKTLYTGKNEFSLPAIDNISDAFGSMKTIFVIGLGIFVLTLFKKGK